MAGRSPLPNLIKIFLRILIFFFFFNRFVSFVHSFFTNFNLTLTTNIFVLVDMHLAAQLSQPAAHGSGNETTTDKSHQTSIGRLYQLSHYWSFSFHFVFDQHIQSHRFSRIRSTNNTLRCLAAIFSSVLASICCIYSMWLVLLLLFSIFFGPLKS